MTNRNLRAKSIKRIHECQRALTEAQLASLKQKQSQLEKEQREIIELLDRQVSSSGLLVGAANRKLKAIAGDLQVNQAQQLVATQSLIEKTARARTSEELSIRLVLEDNRETEKRSLLDMIDVAEARRMFSLR